MRAGAAATGSQVHQCFRRTTLRTLPCRRTRFTTRFVCSLPACIRPRRPSRTAAAEPRSFSPPYHARSMAARTSAARPHASSLHQGRPREPGGARDDALGVVPEPLLEQGGIHAAEVAGRPQVVVLVEGREARELAISSPFALDPITNAQPAAPWSLPRSRSLPGGARTRSRSRPARGPRAACVEVGLEGDEAFAGLAEVRLEMGGLVHVGVVPARGADGHQLHRQAAASRRRAGSLSTK